MQPNSDRLVRATAQFGAFALIAASAGFGTYYGFTAGFHYGYPMAVAFGLAALGGEALKPFAMHAAVKGFTAGKHATAGLCAALAAVCVVYSFVAEISLSAGTRGDAVAERQASNGAAGDVKVERARLTAQLAEVKAGRSVAELQPLVAAARERCRIVVTSTSRDTVCAKDPALVAELGRAERRERLEAALAALPAVATAHAVKAADPGADALAFYAGALGFVIPAASMTMWLYLIPVLFLELGSTLGVLVAAEVGRSEPEADPAGATTEPSGSTRTDPDRNDLRKVQPVAMSRVAAERYLVTQLALHRSIPSQDWLAAQCGVRKSTMHDWVKAWKAAGLIDTQRIGKHNTIVVATRRRTRRTVTA